jgi:hypothetical protein
MQTITKKLGALSLAASLLIAVLAAASAQERNPDFVLKNDTPWTVEGVYVKNRHTDDWGSDILGNDVVSSGNDEQIHIDDYHCHYDVSLKMGRDHWWTWHGVDLCSTSRMKVWFNFETHTPEAIWN